MKKPNLIKIGCTILQKGRALTYVYKYCIQMIHKLSLLHVLISFIVPQGSI
jgi:hypothetical protein